MYELSADLINVYSIPDNVLVFCWPLSLLPINIRAIFAVTFYTCPMLHSYHCICNMYIYKMITSGWRPNIQTLGKRNLTVPVPNGRQNDHNPSQPVNLQTPLNVKDFDKEQNAPQRF